MAVVNSIFGTVPNHQRQGGRRRKIVGFILDFISAGGVLTPKKTKKNQKKPSQFTNFGVATGFFWFFFGFFWVFLVFFGFFWFFFGFFWDGILTLNSNTKKSQKKPKKAKKNQKKPKKTKRAQITSL